MREYWQFLKRYSRWMFVRPKWVWLFVMIVLSHRLFIFYFPTEKGLINVAVAFLIQIVGALIVVFSIASGVEQLNNRKLSAELRMRRNAWHRSKPRNKTIDGQMAVQIPPPVPECTAHFRIEVSPLTVEQRLASLEAEVKNTRQECDRNLQGLRRDMDARTDEASQLAAKALRTATQNSKDLEAVTIGDLSKQLVGVGLILYGAVISLLSSLPS